MERPIPTVEQILSDTLISNNYHRGPAEGGSLLLHEDHLRPGLEDAYDPTDPDWELFVTFDHLDP